MEFEKPWLGKMTHFKAPKIEDKKSVSEFILLYRQ